MIKKCIFMVLAVSACLWGLAAGAQVPAAKTPITRSAQPAAKKALPEPVEMRLDRKKVVIFEGKEGLVSAEQAQPGDVLLETVTYTNRSASTVKSSEVTLPVPANTELVVGTPLPASVKVSLDGIKFADFPIKRKVRQANGVVTEVPAAIGEYRYLRWYPGDLEAGKSLVFSARFKVSDDRPAKSPVSKP